MLLLEVLLILEKEYQQNSLQLFIKCCKVFLDCFFLQKVLSLGFAILM